MQDNTSSAKIEFSSEYTHQDDSQSYLHHLFLDEISPNYLTQLQQKSQIVQEAQKDSIDNKISYFLSNKRHKKLSVRQEKLKEIDPALHHQIQQKFKQKIQSNIKLCLKTLSHLNQSNQMKVFFPRKPYLNIDVANISQKERFQLKQALAVSFCFQGYGVSHAIDEIEKRNTHIHLNKRKYNILMSSVVTETYRRMQIFLKENCKKDIQFATALQLRLLFTMLLNCRKTLTQQQQQAFFNFMKISYGIQNILMTQSSALTLYIKVQSFLSFKIIQKPIIKANTKVKKQRKQYEFKKGYRMRPFQQRKIWTTSMEEKFLQLYKQFGRFAPIRSYFISNYPQYSNEFSRNDFRQKFFKMIRTGIKRLKDAVFHLGAWDIPQLVEIDDHTLKMITSSPKYLTLRNLLGDFYIKKDYSNNELCILIPQVNHIIMTNQNKQKEKQICRKGSRQNNYIETYKSLNPLHSFKPHQK